MAVNVGVIVDKSMNTFVFYIPLQLHRRVERRRLHDRPAAIGRPYGSFDTDDAVEAMEMAALFVLVRRLHSPTCNAPARLLAWSPIQR